MTYVVYTSLRQFRPNPRLRIPPGARNALTLSHTPATPFVVADLAANACVQAVYGPYEAHELPFALDQLSSDKQMWHR